MVTVYQVFRYLTEIIWRNNYPFPTYSLSAIDNFKIILIVLEDCCVEYWFEKTRKCMSMWTGRHDITEILLKAALNPIQSIKIILTKIWKTSINDSEIIGYSWKHCSKLSNSTLWVIFPFATMFSNVVCCWCVCMWESV